MRHTERREEDVCARCACAVGVCAVCGYALSAASLCFPYEMEKGRQGGLLHAPTLSLSIVAKTSGSIERTCGEQDTAQWRCARVTCEGYTITGGG